jgi:hypothetical protein
MRGDHDLENAPNVCAPLKGWANALFALGPPYLVRALAYTLADSFGLDSDGDFI